MNLDIEIKQALKQRPDWTAKRALENANNYVEGKLITKYNSKDITPLKQEDVEDTKNYSETDLRKVEQDGITHVKQSKLAYFVMAGGISTSMGGLSKAQLIAKNNLTFLEIKLNHVRYMQEQYDCKIPFILMTNEDTDEDITQFLNEKDRLKNIDLIKIIQPQTVRFEETNQGLKVAKINEKVSYAPGGHYDSFILLKEIKEELERKGIKTIYLNNIDNLGATINPKLIGMHLNKKSYFTCEISRKEPDDKGGTFARINGELRLLEGPMVPEDYKQQFQDIQTNKYFNTNLIYIDTDIFNYFDEINPKVPTFINQKVIEGKQVFGFEAAIGLVFGMKKSALINVQRQERFIPIKFLSDLWLLRSNFIKLDTKTWSVYQQKQRKPQIKLNEEFISNLEDFNTKIADGGETTDFLELESLDWQAQTGNVESKVKFKGKVVITQENCYVKEGEVVGLL